MNNNPPPPASHDQRTSATVWRWAGNLALMLTAILICLGLMELATRWSLSGIGTNGNASSYLSRKWAEQNPTSRNRLGFREADFTPFAAPGVLRIAAVGDSFTYGAGILEPERISNRIEAAMNERGVGRFEVLNFGEPGANFEEHADNLKVAINEAHPHFILLQWYLNDLDDESERRPRPKQLGWKLHHRLDRISALYGLANAFFSDTQIKLGLVPADAYYARFSDTGDPIANRAEARLAHVIQIAREAGLPIAIYAWPELTRDVGSSPNDVLIDRLLEICRRDAIPCVDLRPALLRERDHEKLIVNRFDTHGSAYANDLASRELLHWLGPIWVRQSAKLQEEMEN